MGDDGLTAGMSADRALWVDPFAGDDSDYRTLRNAIIRTRTPHECAACLDPIPAGTRDVRVMTQAFEDQLATWWWCPACVAAMRAEDAWTRGDMDDGEDLPPFERRMAIGQERARARREVSGG